MLRVLTIAAIWLFTPGQPLSFPVFGTKRYHRSSNVALMPQSSSSLVQSQSIPYYNTMTQYYDEQQPVYAPPNYHYTHMNDDAYYYQYPKPRHEYHTYGMPTYHGEYKPSPYYYAPGPSYNYYDDREIANNPLDDLHEEILQEDEREKQREMIPAGQENWYGHSRKQDAYTKNFLRNLIEYNRQIEAQQQMQKEQENEYDDYMDPVNPAEYEYDQVNDGSYDLANKINKQQLITDNVDESEDENVRQLKSLANAKHQNNNNKKMNHKNRSNQVSTLEENFPNWQQQQQQQQQQQKQFSLPSSSSSMSSGSFAPSSINQYDEEPEYEEEDDWINWDRKRSDNQLKISFPSDESIKAFSNRKPSSVVEHFQRTSASLTKKSSLPTTTTVKPQQSLISSSSSSSSMTSTTTTSKPTNRKFSGQKEVVLPRPATPAQHLFSQPVLDMLDGGGVAQTMNTQTQATSQVDADDENKTSKDSIKSANIYDTIKQLIAMEEQLEKKPSEFKLQKRFVSNEESLVHELDNLKRRSL